MRSIIEIYFTDPIKRCYSKQRLSLGSEEVVRIFRRLLSAAARDRPVCSSLNVELRKGITHGGSAISRQAATRALEAAPSQKDNSCARTMHEAAMTMTAYGSVNSRALERLNQAYRVMAFCFFTQLLRYFALSLRKFAHSLRRKADTDPRTPCTIAWRTSTARS